MPLDASRGVAATHYNKVTGCLSVCLFVPKDLVNRGTDMVLLNRVASHRSREGL